MCHLQERLRYTGNERPIPKSVKKESKSINRVKCLPCRRAAAGWMDAADRQAYLFCPRLELLEHVGTIVRHLVSVLKTLHFIPLASLQRLQPPRNKPFCFKANE